MKYHEIATSTLIRDEKEALRGMRDAREGRIPPVNPSRDYCIGYNHEIDRKRFAA